jgi:hypothetical protein
VAANVLCQIKDKEQPILFSPDDMQFLHVLTGAWNIHIPKCRYRLDRVYSRNTTSNIYAIPLVIQGAFNTQS